MNDSHVTFECKDDDFLVRGQDKAEVMKYGRMHIKEKHMMDASDADLEAHITQS